MSLGMKKVVVGGNVEDVEEICMGGRECTQRQSLLRQNWGTLVGEEGEGGAGGSEGFGGRREKDGFLVF